MYPDSLHLDSEKSWESIFRCQGFFVYLLMSTQWTAVKDRHTETRWSRGRVWIRMDRESRVTGIYWTDGDEKSKRVPRSEEEEELEGARLWVEILIETLETPVGNK
jgi:hypothetical protein